MPFDAYSIQYGLSECFVIINENQIHKMKQKKELRIKCLDMFLIAKYKLNKGNYKKQ